MPDTELLLTGAMLQKINLLINFINNCQIKHFSLNYLSIFGIFAL